MNIQTTFAVVPAAELVPLREQYLANLIEPQELLLEVMVPSATHHRITHRGETCGYFLVHNDDTLLELYVHEPYWVFAEAIFKQIQQRTGVRRALVKSFDHLFLSSVIAHQTQVRSLGLLVRDYLPRMLPDLGLRFTTRIASCSDHARIAGVDQRVFTHAARLRQVVERGRVTLFEDDETLLGFGILQPVVDGRCDVDIGIAVDAPFRNRGYAVYMFRHMVERCLNDGYRPIAGCAESNRPSRSLGERIGMVARYRLLELTFAA